MGRKRVGLLFGGRSVEHEVSLASATSILNAIDRDRYDVIPIAVAPDGSWHLGTGDRLLSDALSGTRVDLLATPGPQSLVSEGREDLGAAADLDIIFPIIHGKGGEDGSLQGLLDLAGVAYVGSGVLGSALQMDKDVAKRLLAAGGLPVVPWISLRPAEIEAWDADDTKRAVDSLGLPLFVKPANLGSSVGISRVERAEELLAALREAGRYDTKVLIERGLDAREIEVAILGNDPYEASVPGEIRTRSAFYDYEAKYADDSTELIVPAELAEEQAEAIRQAAISAVRILEGTGLARVDFLLENGSGDFFINEVNSLPGFTDASMYPRLWEASGLAYGDLLDRLIELGLARHRERIALETRYRSD